VPASNVALVTGAFGNTGAAIARLLHAEGCAVRTVTTHAPADRGDIEAFGFGDPRAFDGVDTFVNTFWMRTGDPGSHGTRYTEAVDRATELLASAAAAGVRRIVHLSVAHADHPAAQKYPYFAAKARVEQVLRDTGVAHTIVRPALIFGGASGMLEQLAMVLRRAPVFGVAGAGEYRVRPVHVDDVARLCVAHVDGPESVTVDAVGPDRPTFDELVRLVAAALGRRARIVHLPTGLVVGAGRLLGMVTRQDLLTGDELRSTMEGLADTDGPATGTVSLTAWVAEHGAALGR
jgi:uncharacterized protein YbjT (DUF2867 family)